MGYPHQGCATSIGTVFLKDASSDVHVYHTIGVIGFVFLGICNVLGSVVLLRVILRLFHRNLKLVTTPLTLMGCSGECQPFSVKP